jgi:hypothetical protein
MRSSDVACTQIREREIGAYNARYKRLEECKTRVPSVIEIEA